jgi:hypothetical protein
MRETSSSPCPVVALEACASMSTLRQLQREEEANAGGVGRLFVFHAT